MSNGSPLAMPASEPPLPNMDEVRKLVDAAIEEERIKAALPPPLDPTALPPLDPGSAGGPTPRPGRPRVPRIRQLRVRNLRIPTRKRATPVPKPPRQRPRVSNNAMGMGILIALIVAVIVAFVLFVSSLVSMISDILG